MSARLPLLAAGAALLLLAALAWGGASLGRWFQGDPVQAAIHALLATGALASALLARRRGGAATTLATILLALGVVGTLAPRMFGYPERLGLSLRWEVGENAAHLLLGGWLALVAARKNGT